MGDVSSHLFIWTPVLHSPSHPFSAHGPLLTMLPKVANHLFHHTSRAVAAVQNQTGYSFRNVLQLQSSSSPSSAAGNISNWNGTTGSSNSGWNGTGSGGAKSHSGQRFYTGYTVRQHHAHLITFYHDEIFLFFICHNYSHVFVLLFGLFLPRRVGCRSGRYPGRLFRGSERQSDSHRRFRRHQPSGHWFSPAFPSQQHRC